MTGLELALLIFVVILVVVMLIRDGQTKAQIERLDNELLMADKTLGKIIENQKLCAQHRAAHDGHLDLHNQQMEAHQKHLKAHDEAIAEVRRRYPMTGVTITPLDAEGKPCGPAVPFPAEPRQTPRRGDAG